MYEYRLKCGYDIVEVARLILRVPGNHTKFQILYIILWSFCSKKMEPRINFNLCSDYHIDDSFLVKQ